MIEWARSPNMFEWQMNLDGREGRKDKWFEICGLHIAKD
jgi:hypothetical protein